MRRLQEAFLQTPEELSKYVSLRFAPQDVSSVCIDRGELTLTVIRAVLLKLMQFLRDDPACRFTRLTDLTCVDRPDREERFEIVYHLHSFRHNRRVRIKLTTDGKLPVASVSGIFPAAVWYEREIWDMFGAVFSNHPDMRGLLTDGEFRACPLCKDFPVRGRDDMHYDVSRRVFTRCAKASAKGENRSAVVDLNGRAGT